MADPEWRSPPRGAVSKRPTADRSGKSRHTLRSSHAATNRADSSGASRTGTARSASRRSSSLARHQQPKDLPTDETIAVAANPADRLELAKNALSVFQP
jgi:hypothetical protein